jgi:hypothetical protein
VGLFAAVCAMHVLRHDLAALAAGIGSVMLAPAAAL